MVHLEDIIKECWKQSIEPTDILVEYKKLINIMPENKIFQYLLNKYELKCFYKNVAEQQNKDYPTFNAIHKCMKCIGYKTNCKEYLSMKESREL